MPRPPDLDRWSCSGLDTWAAHAIILPQGASDPAALLKALLAVAKTQGDSGRSSASSRRELRWAARGVCGITGHGAHVLVTAGQVTEAPPGRAAQAPPLEPAQPTHWPSPSPCLASTPESPPTTLPATTMGASHPSMSHCTQDPEESLDRQAAWGLSHLHAEGRKGIAGQKNTHFPKSPQLHRNF